MRDLVRAFDNLPWIFKLILCLPGIDGIAWGIYRIAKGIDRKDNTMIIVGFIWIIVGAAILWIIDMISVIMYGKVVFVA
jgi:hypothetical protein